MENLNIVFQHVLKPKWLLVFAITANNLLVVINQVVLKLPVSCICGIAGRNKTSKSIESNPTIKIGYILFSCCRNKRLYALWHRG
jgi:hypothetical protein